MTRRPLPPPEPREPTAIILRIELDNGQFEASIRVPLTEHAHFNEHVARWHELMLVALQQGVLDMQVTLPGMTKGGQQEPTDVGPESPR